MWYIIFITCHCLQCQPYVSICVQRITSPLFMRRSNNTAIRRKCTVTCCHHNNIVIQVSANTSWYSVSLCHYCVERNCTNILLQHFTPRNNISHVRDSAIIYDHKSQNTCCGISSRFVDISISLEFFVWCKVDVLTIRTFLTHYCHSFYNLMTKSYPTCYEILLSSKAFRMKFSIACLALQCHSWHNRDLTCQYF